MSPSTFPGETIEVASRFDREAKAVLSLGDCEDVLPTLPDDFAKLIITSPPYNIGKQYEEIKDLAHYMEAFEPIIEQLVRILSHQGSICWQVGNYVKDSQIFPLDIYFYPIFAAHGLRLRNRIVWHFEHGLHASKRFSGRYETILWFTKSDEYTFHLDPVRIPSKYPGKRHFRGEKQGQPSGNRLGKNPSDFWPVLRHDWECSVWEIPNVKASHPEKTIHPCQFPIELVERCVLALTDDDDWVVDPFAGVATSVIAALGNNRRGMGCERDEQYVRLATGRIADLARGVLPYRFLGKPIYRPSGREKVAKMPNEWLSDGNGEDFQRSTTDENANDETISVAGV